MTEVLKTGWYLLKTKKGQELRAERHLQQQGFEIYCPVSSKQVVFFPTYLFIYLREEDKGLFHKIRSTLGVSGIVTFNRVAKGLYQSGQLPAESYHKLLPSPIPNGERIVEQLENYFWEKNKIKPTNIERAKRFEEGDPVVVNIPLYEHFDAVFLKAHGANRGLVLLKMIEQRWTEEGVLEKTLTGEKEITVELQQLQSKP